MDISVIIPCYNAGRFIGEAVASVLNQEDLPAGLELEIVIADDRSDDGTTPAVLAELARCHPQVRVISNDGPRGPGPARNSAARHARGRWLAFLDADDWWLPCAVQRNWALIAGNPQAQWVVSAYRAVYEAGTRRGGGKEEDIPFAADIVLANARPVSGGLCVASPFNIDEGSLAISTSAVMIQKTLFDAAGGFDERFLNAQDLHLWLRLSVVTDLYHVPEIISIYRRRSGSETMSGKPPAHWDVRCHIDLYGDPRFRPVRAQFARRIAYGCLKDNWFYRESGQYRRAVKATLLGLRYMPTDGRLWRSLVAALANRH